MTRTKLRLIRRITLGLAIAAVVPAVAQARPVDMTGSDLRAIHAAALSSSQDKLAPARAPDLRSLHAEALAASQYRLGPGEIPSIEENFQWPSSEQGMPPTVARNASGFDVDFGVVTGVVLILLLFIAGVVVAARRVRETRMAPA